MKEYKIDAWGDRGYFGVVDVQSDELIAICVYKKGAIEVKRRLDELELKVDELLKKEGEIK